jgi:hypothetical protein
MGRTFRRRHDVRAAINARVKRKERERQQHKEHTSVTQVVSDRLEDSLSRARQEVMARGGLITVALGSDIELPKRWQDEPRVFPMNTVGLSYHQIHDAMPSNTRIVILTDRIPNTIFQPIHKEIKRRHINYLVRKTEAAVDDELARWIPKHSAPVVEEELPPPPPPTPPPPPPSFTAPAPLDITDDRETSYGDELLATSAPAAAEQKDDDVAKRQQNERGSISAFILQYANLKDQSSSIAEESRRLFRIAQQKGIKTTVGSLAQQIRMLKRKHGYGSKPESLAPVQVRVEFGILTAVDTAIEALTGLRDAVQKMDANYAGVIAERDKLKARLDLLTEAFKGTAD